ncbi:MAG: threonine--tRNA ligase [Proteobacteria bacterium]|nr:threonine--tRNA ligase [Desulfobulbaceae bacterium]MBU4152238.1 threonine--tRNA ligase [Pseudomonadota bacterium]
MSEICISNPTGESKDVPNGSTVAEAIKSLYPNKVRKSAVAARVNGNLVDLSSTLTENAVVEAISVESTEGLDVLRHSAAHIMAQAVLDLYGHKVQVTIGPSVEDGFYYDFDKKEPFSTDDFEKIEVQMQSIVDADRPFVRTEVSKAEALAFFQEKGQKYKLEIIQELDAERVSLYQQGDFVDLCRGPHLPSTGWLKAFTLIKVAGAYWRGDEKNAMLQRLYGTAFADPKALKLFLYNLEEAKKRDHRKLGKELELFTISDQVGPGLILWQPKGAQLRKLLEDYWKDEHYRNDYELLFTPQIARRDLWKTSGHLDFYVDDMFSPMVVDDVNYQIKPMNCPFHIAIYQSRKRSYREFPIRWCELGTVYRYERTGALHGLMRVRGFTQDDAHIFCLPQQLEKEIFNILDLNLHILKTFGFSDYQIYLSTRPEKYVGSDGNWEKATDALKLALENKGLSFQVDPGEGVFYGPKIDIKIRDVLGRYWQCSTIQVDFNLPERFGITYTGEDGAEHQPIMIHRALMGSLERFFGVLIEHYAGVFPLWLAPVQARVMNISDAQAEYAEGVYRQMKKSGIRIEKDFRNEKLNYKIRQAQLVKIPYMLIIGDKEVEEQKVTVRLRDGQNLPAMSVPEFIEMIRVESQIPVSSE